MILAEGETFTVLQFSTFTISPGSNLYVYRPPFEVQLFYDPTDYDNSEKMIIFSSLSLAGIYSNFNSYTAGGSAITSSELSRTYVGPCKIRITRTVSDEDCYLAYKITRAPNPQTAATD